MREQARAELERRRLEARRWAAVRHLAWFVRALWPVIEPRRKLVWGWHMDLICRRLEASYRGELGTNELVINIPPRHSKSSLVSVLGPAWWWLHHPEAQFLALTKADRNAARDARMMRLVVKSDSYRELLVRMAILEGRDPGATWRIQEDQDQVHDFANSEGGRRVSATTTSESITGSGADVLIVDDPHDAEEVARSSPEQTVRLMRLVREKYEQVWTTRLNPGGVVQCIMQRLHQADLAGVLLDQGAAHLVLPWEYEPTHPFVDPEDPRSVEGELLAPERFGEDVQARVDASPTVKAGQYQQRPSPQAGGLFRREWFERRRWHGDWQALGCTQLGIFLDCAFKAKDDSDFVVFEVWGRKGPDRFLIDQVRARMSYTATRAALVALSARYPTALVKVVEDKANGSALIDDLKTVIPGLIAFDPGTRSKYERASVSSAVLAEAGNIILPSDAEAPWVPGWIEEHAAFPNGAHDDQVDATSMMALYWSRPELGVSF